MLHCVLQYLYISLWYIKFNSPVTDHWSRSCWQQLFLQVKSYGWFPTMLFICLSSWSFWQATLGCFLLWSTPISLLHVHSQRLFLYLNRLTNLLGSGHIFSSYSVEWSMALHVLDMNATVTFMSRPSLHLHLEILCHIDKNSIMVGIAWKPRNLLMYSFIIWCLLWEKTAH